SLSGSANPKLLIIPHAGNDPEKSGAKNLEIYRRLGIKNITVLDLNKPTEALKAIQESDLIWMPGGQQRRLINALDEAGLTDAIRARVAEGATIGGSSAGAAIMSKTMIASSD